jgi:hypothetical protein
LDSSFHNYLTAKGSKIKLSPQSFVSIMLPLCA